MYCHRYCSTDDGTYYDLERRMSQNLIKTLLPRSLKECLQVFAKLVDGLRLLSAFQPDARCVVHHDQGEDRSDGEIYTLESEAQQTGNGQCRDRG